MSAASYTNFTKTGQGVMKTSKVYFIGTLNSGKKASKLTLCHCQAIIGQDQPTARQKWSPQQFPHPLPLPP